VVGWDSDRAAVRADIFRAHELVPARPDRQSHCSPAYRERRGAARHADFDATHDLTDLGTWW
jgi:hypothetical protein